MTTQPSSLQGARLLLVGTTAWVEPLADALAADTGASVQRAATRGDALDAFREQSVDGVVAECDPDDGAGLAVLRAVRSETASVPVVLATASGDETTASDAIGAGASDYVPVGSDLDAAVDELVARTERAMRSARRRQTQRDRARQFDATFHDARAATWVLDPDGSLARANGAAREMVDADIRALVDEPFWALPWWTAADGAAPSTASGDSAAAADGARADVRRVVETALDGDFGNAVVTGAGRDGGRVIDLSARPVENERGDLVSVVVEGVDITDRVDLERDLRRSEELHRVTLNNMTDTVLMTDEDGDYTYVCPNVHFIFGYTAEEIRERGTIEDLLGDDLFDREALAEAGVLKNIETTATDKAGREHTLLVNVREVSIQDGTLLYSCRDVTKRKQREVALATLQETARDFLYAETHREIAQQVVDDAAGVLDVDASAVYRFDADTNDLRPTAATQAMEDLNGPLPDVHAGDESLPSHSFVADEPLFFDDVHDADRLGNRATGLRSVAYIPLGNHGVFVAGSGEVGAFDEVTRELADLLAATAEAAFDRVSRESKLREQDRELQTQNDRLTALNRINETIREIDQALVQAETREEIDHTVCELLTADDRFGFAWIGETDAADAAVEPRAWAGDERGYLDSQGFPVEPDGVEPAGRTAATRELTVVENVPGRLRAESWRTDALSRDYLSAVGVPLSYNDLTYGVLTVYAETPNAFDGMVRAVFAELGETIASAISAIERKNALLTTSMTRVEFGADDPAFVLTRLASEADCTLSYRGGARQTEAGSYVFVTVEDAPLDAVEAVANDLVAVDAVQRIGADATGGVLRLRLAQPFLAQELADHGAVLRSATASPAASTLVVDVPDTVSVRHVTGLVEDAVGGVDLRSKQTRDQADRSIHAEFFEALTDRQLEVVQTAFYSGFFESPRAHSGEDIADTLGISSSAFYQHTRAVQRKLFSVLFDERGVPQPDPTDGVR